MTNSVWTGKVRMLVVVNLLAGAAVLLAMAALTLSQAIHSVVSGNAARLDLSSQPAVRSRPSERLNYGIGPAI